MPFRWLGQWLSTQDRAIAAKWVQSINPKNYFEAVFDNWAIGQWVKSSVHRHFRHNVLDLSDHLIASTYGSYLYSGLLACLALNRLFDEEKPDAQLLFNGRMGIPRVALELGKSKGIRTICEERGYVPGRIMLFDNVNCLDFTGFSNLWSAWKETPLSREEIDEIGGLLIDRWHGRTSDITLFSPGMVSGQKLIAALELNPQLQTWALYTSSLDESVDLESERDAFPSQYAWIDATVDFVAAHPEIQLVIRVHPNAGSQKSLGANTQDQDYFQKLTARLPRNVRLIPSDSNHSSYDLAAVSTLGLIWRSTIGVEMAAMGRKVIRLGAGLLTNAEFMTAPSSQSKYIECLDAAAHCAPKPDLAEAIKAWRFACTSAEQSGRVRF